METQNQVELSHLIFEFKTSVIDIFTEYLATCNFYLCKRSLFVKLLIDSHGELLLRRDPFVGM